MFSSNSDEKTMLEGGCLNISNRSKWMLNEPGTLLLSNMIALKK